MPSPSRVRAVMLLAFVVGPLAAGCDDMVTISPGQETMALGARAMRAKVWTPTEQEPVTLDVRMPSTVKYGQTVPITVRLHNGTPRPIAIGFGQVEGFDVIVAQVGMHADSGAVWSPLKIQSMTREATITDPLPPGRDTTFEVTWPTTDDLGHRVPRGRYRVRAVVAAALMQTRQLWSPWLPIVVQ